MTPQLAVLAIVAAVILGSVVLYGLFALVSGSRAVAAEEEPTLVERAAAIRPPRTFFGRFDRWFSDAVRGTLFDLTTERTIEIILVSGGVGALIAYIVTDDLLAMVFAFLAAATLATLVFFLFSYRRRRAIQDQLPDGCFQLARCLRAGLGLTAAVKESAEYTATPLSTVFTAIAGRLELGMHPGQAFAAAAEDVKLTDFDLLAAVMDLHADIGGNLPAMLDKLAASIRDRNQFRGYVRSVTSLSRITTLFVASAAPVAFLFYLIFEPEPGLFTNFLKAPLGLALLAVAVVLEIVGVIWSFWLLRRAEDY